MALNQEDIVGSLLPDVLISRITLESSGQQNIEDNPHISHKSETVSLKDKPDKALNITLDLLINEKITDDVIGSWFDQINFKKYLKIRIYQSTSDRLTAALSLSNDMLEVINPESKLVADDPKIKLVRHRS